MSSELASSTATYSSSQMGVSSQASLMNKFLSFLLKLLPDPGHPHGPDGPASRLFSVFADRTREEAFIELSIILGFTILVSCTYKVVSSCKLRTMFLSELITSINEALLYNDANVFLDVRILSVDHPTRCPRAAREGRCTEGGHDCATDSNSSVGRRDCALQASCWSS
ncbi:hypothetical protein F5051DRAFT_447427 [Lentinula edodes]|nr:hypothetical protein F5051DRAFT_447427 [Lentinula edodes]